MTASGSSSGTALGQCQVHPEEQHWDSVKDICRKVTRTAYGSESLLMLPFVS
jgi:hypothetical protein